jgi:transporter family protein
MGVVTVSQTYNKVNTNSLSGIDWIKGVTAALSAGLFWSIALIVYKYILDTGDVPVFSAIFIRMIGFLPFLFAALVVTGDVKTSTTLTKRDIIALAAAGILALGLGGTFIFISLSFIEASRAIPLSSISPLLTLFLASLFTREKITTKIVVGTVLVVAGVILLTFSTS